MELLKYLELCKKLKETDKIWHNKVEIDKIFGKFIISDSGSVIKIEAKNLDEMISKEILLPYNNSDSIFLYAKKNQYALLKSPNGFIKVIDSKNASLFANEKIHRSGQDIVSYIYCGGKKVRKCVEKIILFKNEKITEEELLDENWEQHHFLLRCLAILSFIDVLPSKVHDQVHSILTEYRRSETFLLNALNIDKFFESVEYYDLRMQKLREEFLGN